MYVIARPHDHTHLAFALELPKRPGEVQEELNIPSEGSYIITVRNPEADVPPGAGLPEEDRPDLPQRTHERFHGCRFIPVDPPDFLDREGTELVLIGADEDVVEELGLRLEPEHELSKRRNYSTISEWNDRPIRWSLCSRGAGNKRCRR